MKPCLLLLLSSITVQAQINILTANGNNDRSNANLQEYQLSSATVTANGFGKLGSYPVDGQVYAQPLYAAGITIPNIGVRNVLFVATMHNTVYAFDADAITDTGVPPAPLWRTNLGPSVPSEMFFGTPYSDIANEVGILGTGAIDLDRGVLLICSATLLQGVPAYILHALDLASGAERLNGPVQIQASVPGNGSGAQNGTLAFSPQQHLQRPGILLANGSVYVSFGSHGDQAPWHGWLLSYDAADLTHSNGVFQSTPTGNGGSFWQSGHGPAADNNGTIYAITGNGDYDGEQNFSQSLLRLSGAQPTLTGWYTPADWKSMSDNDFDLSAGPSLVSGTHTMLGGDKGGNLYALDGDTMAHTASPAAPGMNSIQASTGAIFNLAVWPQSDGALVYVQGGNDNLKAYRVTGSTIDATPVSTASALASYARIGLTLSADGANPDSGILWETQGDYNDDTTLGTLHAYKASDLSVELWNSDMNQGRDQMGAIAKFACPTVANGRVYVATFSNRVDFYGLLPQTGVQTPPPAITAFGNAASYQNDAIAPGELISIFGANLGPPSGAGLTLDSNGMVTTSLGNTRVLFDGLAAPLIYASATQVNAIVPFGLSVDNTQLSVEYQGQASDTVPISVAQAIPGIFSADGSGAGAAIVANQDGSINSADNPAAAGSVITLYATGTGPLSPSAPDGSVITSDNLPIVTLPVVAMVGGMQATVLYAGGAPGMVLGVEQVNLQIPATAAPGSAVPLVLQAGERYSQTGLTIAIGNATQGTAARLK
ncbi:MAG TPA: hypothetical protein VNV86_22985 [Candidatus Acidoferrum sp.]|nr:hypothetical protein [Candidatus Acidoferrum sp.]